MESTPKRSPTESGKTLTRLAAASWGFSLARSREVYTKVIRSAMGSMNQDGMPWELLEAFERSNLNA